jgi:hypothetical protein
MEMLCRIRGLVALCGLFVSTQAFCFAPCGEGLKGIELTEGTHNPPGLISPDVDSTIEGMKWPQSLLQQGWHNLKKAERPLLIKCIYQNGTFGQKKIPPDIDSCTLFPGLKVICK